MQVLQTQRNTEEQSRNILGTLEESTRNNQLSGENTTIKSQKNSQKQFSNSERISKNKQLKTTLSDASLQKKKISVRLPNIHSDAARLHSSQKEKQKSEAIRKLTNQNKKLIQQLKQLNDKLTNIISKQALKSVRKKQNASSLQETQISKELVQAYRQIDCYKKMIAKQKSKELPIEQMSRITDLQNKIRSSVNESKSIQKQIRTIDGIKETQQKEISKSQTQGPRVKISRLTNEIQQQKQVLKNIRKETLKISQYDRQHHQYLIILEKLFKDLSEGGNKKKEGNVEHAEPTEQEWQELKNNLTETKTSNENQIKNIQTMKRKKDKLVISWQTLQTKLKQRHKHLVLAQKKFHDIQVLMIGTGAIRKQQRSLQSQASQGTKWLPQEKNTIHNNKLKIVGKVFKGSIFFSDAHLFARKQAPVKIIKLTVWTNKKNQFCGLTATYMMNQNENKTGHLIGYCSDSSSKEINLNDDYIIKIKGTFNKKGMIVSVVVVTQKGFETSVGIEGQKQFQVSKNGSHLKYVEGVFLSREQGASISQLRCCFERLEGESPY